MGSQRDQRQQVIHFHAFFKMLIISEDFIIYFILGLSPTRRPLGSDITENCKKQNLAFQTDNQL